MSFAFLIAVTNGQKKRQHRRTTKVYHDIKTINNNIIIFKDDFPTISLEKITLEDGLSIAEILCQNIEPYPEFHFKAILIDHFDKKEINLSENDYFEYFDAYRVPISNGANKIEFRNNQSCKLVPLDKIYVGNIIINSQDKKISIKPLTKLLNFSKAPNELAQFSIRSNYLALAHQKRLRQMESEFRQQQFENNFNFGKLKFICLKTNYEITIPHNYIIPWCNINSNLIKKEIYQYDFILIEIEEYWTFFWKIIVTQKLPTLKDLIYFFKIKGKKEILKIIDFTVMLSEYFELEDLKRYFNSIKKGFELN